jgi:hypothetical protein
VASLSNPFTPAAEFWIDDGIPVAVDSDGVFLLNVAGEKVSAARSRPWPEAADTRGPLTWDEFLEANRAFDAKIAAW